ncbi:MAG: hypothetical protein JWP91_4384 [Fibrobacteres bacterium]|nr:hypothetical protein [Fibrobacterota bacterium]
MGWKTDRMEVAGNWGRAALLASCLASAGTPVFSEAKLDVSGYAWTQYQQGVTEMYKGAANFDHDPFFSAGGMLFLGNKPSDNWATDLSIGVFFGNSAIKKTIMDTNSTVIGRTNPNSISLGMGAFLYEASVAYHTPSLSLKLGKFHYTYSDYNTNMGLYLLRGPVYPGFIYSGFEEIGALTKMGALTSWTPIESFRWDVLASFETDYKPFMDLNLSSFVTWHAGLVELGAGVESQRLVEFNPCITSPNGVQDVNDCLGGDPKTVTAGPGADLYQSAFLIIDTTGGKADTITYSMAGTKVMIRGALDLKQVMGEYAGSSKDWVFYFEAALLGIKDYPLIYEKKGERIPVLAGVNIPTFGLLDQLSLEAEYYNAPYQNDPYKLVGAYDVFQFSDGNSINYAMSPIPPSNKAGQGHLSKAQVDFDPKKDNLKWSLFASKRVQDRITFKVQVASDHWRVPNNNFVQYEAAANPGQFYGSFRVDYSLR